VEACIKYNVETMVWIAKDQIVSANRLDHSLPAVLLADPEGNEFDLEISVGELGAGGP
jgi:hypothetical protein